MLITEELRTEFTKWFRNEWSGKLIGHYDEDWPDETDAVLAAVLSWMTDRGYPSLHLLEGAEPAWEGETNVDEVQDLVYDKHAHVIDVSKMEPVWIVERQLLPSGLSNPTDSSPPAKEEK